MRSSGFITTRTCRLCGHHEIGFTTNDGEFHPLKPGTRISIVEEPPALEDREKDKSLKILEDHEETQPGSVLWVPDAIRGERILRLKYGVMLSETPDGGKVSRDQYMAAFLAKLQRLIEEESDIPIPVLLDRFFAAPNLAAGNPRQIAEAMWRELDEVKRPVNLMNAWLERQDEESFTAMIHPCQQDKLGHEPICDEDIIKELEALSLEEFLAWL